jgi:hypothetical protein
MKGIYLTEEGKKEIEAKIAELEKEIDKNREFASVFFGLSGRNIMLKSILYSATILPVEESWEIAHDKVINYLIAELAKEETDETDYSTKSLNNFCETTYPNGVIIKPKQGY